MKCNCETVFDWGVSSLREIFWNSPPVCRYIGVTLRKVVLLMVVVVVVVVVVVL